MTQDTSKFYEEELFAYRNLSLDIDFFEKVLKKYYALSSENRQLERNNISKILFLILQKIDKSPIEGNQSFIAKLLSFVEALAVTQSSVEAEEEVKNRGEYIFIRFLHSIQKGVNCSEDVEKIYSELSSEIEKVDWIFSLKDDNNQYVFPLTQLMNTIVDNFSFDNSNLYNLSLLLRIYIKNDLEAGRIEYKITKLVETHNLKCINYLMNGGRQILDSKSIKENQTMIFEQKKKFLIRNPNREYFDVEGSKLEEEKDSKGNVIAYFHEYEVTRFEKMSIQGFLNRENPKYSKKFKFFIDIVKNESFNLFYEDAIYTDDKGDYRILNPFGKNDKKIIFKDLNTENSFSGFFSLIGKEKTSLRQAFLYRRKSFDILTLDFFCSFFDSVVEQSRNTFLEQLAQEDFQDEDFIQNIIIKRYFGLKLVNVNEKINRLKSYVTFLEENLLKYNLDSKMDKEMKLFMPYKIFWPEEVEKHYCYTLVIDNSKSGIFEKFQIVSEVLSRKVKVKGNFVSKVKSLEEDDISIEDLNREHFKYGYYIPSENILYFNEDNSKLGVKINEIKEKYDAMKLEYGVFDELKLEDLENTIKIIQAVKLHNINYEVFSACPTLPNEEKESVAWYKLFWHFYLLKWDVDQIKQFINLVTKRHFTQPAIDYSDKVSLWCEKITELKKETGNLVFQKEKTVGTTLGKYISEYSSRLGGKQPIDNTQLDYRTLSVRDNKLYESATEVKRIILLVDNIMGGTSLTKALNYYFGFTEGIDSNYQYYPGGPEIRGKNFIKLDIPIEVQAIWCSHRWKDGKLEFTFDLSDEKMDISINYVELIPEEFCWNDDLKEILTTLYGEYRRADYLIFRYNNMPYKSVFPKLVTDTSNLIGLFNRAEEYKH